MALKRPQHAAVLLDNLINYLLIEEAERKRCSKELTEKFLKDMKDFLEINGAKYPSLKLLLPKFQQLERLYNN